MEANLWNLGWAIGAAPRVSRKAPPNLLLLARLSWCELVRAGKGADSRTGAVLHVLPCAWPFAALLSAKFAGPLQLLLNGLTVDARCFLLLRQLLADLAAHAILY